MLHGKISKFSALYISALKQEDIICWFTDVCIAWKKDSKPRNLDSKPTKKNDCQQKNLFRKVQEQKNTYYWGKSLY